LKFLQTRQGGSERGSAGLIKDFQANPRRLRLFL